MKKFKSILLSLGLLAGMYGFAGAQTLTTPKEHFGFNIGDDYKLANYTQMDSYFKKLASQSDRVIIEQIGLTEEGREQYLMIVSSPENLKNIDKYKSISQKMGRAEISEEEAKRLSKEGKPVIWIDGGMHSTETVGSHQLVETYYQLLSRNDEEIMNILDKVIIVMCHINPDGQELIADWYMQEEDEKNRNMSIPRLYQKYVGHDNNRDFYMYNMKEATNVALALFVEWLPQVVYNHHQTSPAGTIVAGPPYRDPFNHVFDPLLITSIDAVGAAMINRLNVEDKPGYTRLDGAVFSTWWNGGLRTIPYFHNMVGILTEVHGNPTPSQVPLVLDRLIPDNNTPNPIGPRRTWHFRESIDYSVSMNYAILDYASRYGDQLLFNFYKMGRNSIENGNKDSWTKYPKYAEMVKELYEKDRANNPANNNANAGGFRGGNAISADYFDQVFKNKEYRDPRGYVISADQVDFATSIKFLNSLIKSGIQVEVATQEFTLAGKTYPKGSYVVKTNQAFRPHILDMFEPQNHPNDFAYVGGPPVRPYDAAGWTLAIQMGADFDRVYDAVEGPFQRLTLGELIPMPSYTFSDSRSGYYLDARANNSFLVVNELLKNKVKVSRVTQNEGNMVAGSFYVPSNAKNLLTKLASEHGIQVTPASQRPKNTLAITPSRIALYDYYGGSMPSGWVRWLLEQFDFDFQLIYPNDINEGDLASKYDVILFIGDGLPDMNGNANLYGRQPNRERVPQEYHYMLGRLDVQNSVPKIKAFIENGGKVVTVGGNSSLAYHLGLEVENHLLENSRPIPGEKFYVPTSILKSQVNTQTPATWGMKAETPVMYNNNPVFKIKNTTQIEPIMWFGEGDLLVSGWAWGENYLYGGVNSFKSKIGKGEYYAFGPEIIFRAQSHSTFKLLFNQLYK